MRGALDTSMPLIIVFGIIPAYAGSTIYSVNANGALRDHPRVCGEHSNRGHIPVREWGSSPRMRGAQGIRFVKWHVYGIIPAYAGSTPDYRNSWDMPRDHPRVCGEHLLDRQSFVHQRGSSPRMRGALWLVCTKDVCIGIIPAYAGSTARFLRQAR